MVKTLKRREIRQRTRQKYVRTRRHIQSQERSERLNARSPIERLRTALRGRPPKMRLNEAEKEKLLTEISKERNPDKLKEKMELARKNDLLRDVRQKDKERLEKMERARQRLRETIKKLESQKEMSADQKEAIQAMKAGHSDQAMKGLEASGRDGAIGNEIAAINTEMATHLGMLSKESGKHADSIMKKMIAEHSTPMSNTGALKLEKKTDKSDQNLEEKQTKDSTMQQMVQQKIRERKMRG